MEVAFEAMYKGKEHKIADLELKLEVSKTHGSQIRYINKISTTDATDAQLEGLENYVVSFIFDLCVST